MNKDKLNNKKEWRTFGIGLAVLLVLIALVQFVKSNPMFPYFALAGAFILFFAFVLPIVIKPLFILFSYIGHCLGWLMTRIILTLLFFGIFTLLGLIMRLSGKRFLNIEYPQQVQSFWINTEKTTTNFEEQF
jgi:hypothetical protein